MAWWAPLDRLQRFVLLKMITGELRVGVSQTLVVRALGAGGRPAGRDGRGAADGRLDADRRSGSSSLASVEVDRRRSVAPVSVLPGLAARGRRRRRSAMPADWLLEWKWDGIRAQLVKRGGAIHLWSRGEEIITHRFPEIVAAATHLPDGTVLDGEVLAFRDDRPLPFSALQQRIGRQKQVAQMARAVPVVFMTYDILEQHGEDIRPLPLGERRARLALRRSARPAGGRAARLSHGHRRDLGGARGRARASRARAASKA